MIFDSGLAHLFLLVAKHCCLAESLDSTLLSITFVAAFRMANFPLFHHWFTRYSRCFE